MGLHGDAGDLAVARTDGAANDVVVVVAVREGVGKVLGATDGVDEEVAHVPHAFAELGHDAGVSHVVDDQVEVPVEEPIPAGAGRGVGALLEVGDALPSGVELAELCVGPSKGGSGSDLALETAEQVEEVEDLLRGVARHPAATLRHDLDDADGLEAPHGVHDGLLRRLRTRP